MSCHVMWWEPTHIPQTGKKDGGATTKSHGETPITNGKGETKSRSEHKERVRRSRDKVLYRQDAQKTNPTASTMQWAILLEITEIHNIGIVSNLRP